jgi:hypothetical protein
MTPQELFDEILDDGGACVDCPMKHIHVDIEREPGMPTVYLKSRDCTVEMRGLSPTDCPAVMERMLS